MRRHLYKVFQKCLQWSTNCSIWYWSFVWIVVILTCPICYTTICIVRISDFLARSLFKWIVTIFWGGFTLKWRLACWNLDTFNWKSLLEHLLIHSFLFPTYPHTILQNMTFWLISEVCKCCEFAFFYLFTLMFTQFMTGNISKCCNDTNSNWIANMFV